MKWKYFPAKLGYEQRTFMNFSKKCGFHGNQWTSNLALYLKMLVLVTAINVPNFMLVSKSAQFAWNFELCRRTINVCIKNEFAMLYNGADVFPFFNSGFVHQKLLFSLIQVHWGRRIRHILIKVLPHYSISGPFPAMLMFWSYLTAGRNSAFKLHTMNLNIRSQLHFHLGKHIIMVV